MEELSPVIISFTIIRWAEMLRELVMPVARQLLRERRLRYFVLHGPTSFGQLVANSRLDPLASLSANASAAFVDTELLMFHYSQLPGEAKNVTLEEAAGGDGLLSQLLRLALTRCWLEEGAEGPKPGRVFSLPLPEPPSPQLVDWIRNTTQELPF